MDEFGDFRITDQYFETNTIASSGADPKEEELKLGPERKRAARIKEAEKTKEQEDLEKIPGNFGDYATPKFHFKPSDYKYSKMNGTWTKTKIKIERVGCETNKIDNSGHDPKLPYEKSIDTWKPKNTKFGGRIEYFKKVTPRAYAFSDFRDALKSGASNSVKRLVDSLYVCDSGGMMDGYTNRYDHMFYYRYSLNGKVRNQEAKRTNVATPPTPGGAW